MVSTVIDALKLFALCQDFTALTPKLRYFVCVDRGIDTFPICYLDMCDLKIGHILFVQSILLVSTGILKCPNKKPNCYSPPSKLTPCDTM